jgi:hypothetical protein
MWKNPSLYMIGSSILEFGHCSQNLWPSIFLNRPTCVLQPKLSQPKILTITLYILLIMLSRNILRTMVNSKMQINCLFGIWRNLCPKSKFFLSGKKLKKWLTWLLALWRRKWMLISANIVSKYLDWTSSSMGNSRSG